MFKTFGRFVTYPSSKEDLLVIVQCDWRLVNGSSAFGMGTLV